MTFPLYLLATGPVVFLGALAAMLAMALFAGHDGSPRPLFTFPQFWYFAIPWAIGAVVLVIPLHLISWANGQRELAGRAERPWRFRTSLYLALFSGLVGLAEAQLSTPDGQAEISNVQWIRTSGNLVSFDEQCGSGNNVCVDLTYCYTVDGRKYFSSRLSLDVKNHVSEAFARTLPHRPGASLPVYYSSLDSTRSILMLPARGPKQFWIPGIPAVLFVVIGWWTWRTYRKVLLELQTQLPESESRQLEAVP